VARGNGKEDIPIVIEPYDPTMSEEVASVYNGAIRDVPHCYPVSVEEIESVLRGATGAGPRDGRLHSQVAFVARQGGSTCGFIHVGVGLGPGGDGPERGVIRFFAYLRGHRRAGAMLLEVGQDHLRQCNMTRVEAFQCEYRYPFYQLHWSCLSDRLDHVRAALGARDYHVMKGELFMNWRDYGPISPDPAEVPAEISLEWEQGQATRPALTVRARRGQEEIGQCHCMSVGEYAQHADAQDWAFVRSLNVTDAEQGKGMGRYLLLRALREMHDVGYRHAVISTATDNYRAMLFYGNYGFRAVDWTYAFGRDL